MLILGSPHSYGKSWENTIWMPGTQGKKGVEISRNLGLPATLYSVHSDNVVFSYDGRIFDVLLMSFYGLISSRSLPRGPLFVWRIVCV